MFSLLNKTQNQKLKAIIAFQKSHQTAEMKILDIFFYNNKDYFDLEKIQVPINEKYPRLHTSSLFKEYPVLYLKSRIFETKKLIPLIYDLIYPDSKNKKHFDYLIYFLYNKFRLSYFSLQSTDIIKNYINTIQNYIEFFKSQPEIHFVKVIINYFVDEFKEDYLFYNIKKNNENKENDLIKSQINEFNILGFENVKKDSLYDKLFCFKKCYLDNDEIMNKYSIQNDNENNENKYVNMSPEEIEANRSWKNNIFSLCLFLGSTGILYLFSLKK